MQSFDKILLRLKESLSVQKDKDVAEVLGISPTAFNGRKKRGLFPEDKLLALVTKRPDLKIDVNYILTGKPSGDMTRAEAKRLGIFKPDPYVAQAIASVGDDESRDEEPFTMAPPTYRLNKDEWELIQRFRCADLTTKMQVMQLLLSVDMTDKTADGFKPEPASSSTQNFHGSVKAEQIAARDINNHGKGRK